MITHLQLTHGDIYLYGDSAAGLKTMMDKDEDAVLEFFEAWSKAIYDASGETHSTKITPTKQQ